MSVSPIDVAWLINSTVDDLESSMKENDELKAQLAAERKKHESCVAWEDHNETLDELQKCREQLAAEREEVLKVMAENTELCEENHTLVDALKDLRKRIIDETLGCENLVQIIDAELAKVK